MVDPMSCAEAHLKAQNSQPRSQGHCPRPNQMMTEFENLNVNLHNLELQKVTAQINSNKHVPFLPNPCLSVDS